jgi:hypothetical protein
MAHKARGHGASDRKSDGQLHKLSLRSQIAGLVVAIALACSVAACGGGGKGNPSAPSQSPSNSGVSGVRAWSGTLEVVSNYSGAGSSNLAGIDILEDFRQETTARLNVTLTKDPAGSPMWAGTAQGTVNIINRNNMTMIAPVRAVVVCTGVLSWVGSDPLFSSSLRLEADSNGSTIRLYLGRVRIPAPDSGSVACPTAGLTFPTTDPNSPFGPVELLSGLSLTPSIGANQSLSAFTVMPGDSGIGGFVASPTRIPYTINLNLNAVP